MAIMACKIDRPDPAVLFNKYLNMFSNTVLGGSSVIPESNEWYATAVNYAVAEEFYAISEQAWKERDPREACCENLIAMAATNGVRPLPAAFAQGFIRLTGIPGSPLPVPVNFTVGAITYITATNSQQPTQIELDGTAIIRVRALTAGEAGNQNITTGTLNQVIPGVDPTVEVCGGTFCNGAPAETCDQFRERYLRRLQYQPRATNQFILDKLLEWPCSTRAYQRAGSCCICDDCGQSGSACDCGCKDCGGALKFYLMFDNSFDCGIAPASVINEVSEWLFGSPQGYGLGQMEVGICGAVVPVTGVLVNVAIDIAACPTPSQLTLLRSLVEEFFTTLVPSTPLRVMNITTIVANVLGPNVNVEVRLDLENFTDGYGQGHPYVDGVSKVFVGNCDLEPDCDFLLCLNNLDFNTPQVNQGNCG